MEETGVLENPALLSLCYLTLNQVEDRWSGEPIALVCNVFCTSQPSLEVLGSCQSPGCRPLATLTLN